MVYWQRWQDLFRVEGENTQDSEKMEHILIFAKVGEKLLVMIYLGFYNVQCIVLLVLSRPVRVCLTKPSVKLLCEMPSVCVFVFSFSYECVCVHLLCLYILR